jgi:hypothetical protein
MVTGEYQDVNVTYAPWADERGAAAVHACEGTHADHSLMKEAL